VRDLLPDIVHLGPPCSSFSAWLHLAPWFSRAKTSPWGNNQHPKERLGNQLLWVTLSIIAVLSELCLAWTLEQPSASYMWHIPQLKAHLSHPVVASAVFDWCRYGRRWRKRTAVCGPAASHIHLKGSTRTPEGWKSWTSIASEYSPAWCAAYAENATLLAHLRREAACRS